MKPVCCSDDIDQSIALSPAKKFSFDAYDHNVLPQHHSTIRKARDAGASKSTNIPSNQLNSFVNVGDLNTHTARRRYARDVSRYYYDDGQRQLGDILERLDGRLSKRQPIDRIDEPSEWRDRLRIMNSRLTERHPLDRFSLPLLFDGRVLSRVERGLFDGIIWIIHSEQKKI